MAKVFLINVSTNWQSKVMDLQSAMIVLSSQTLDQMRNWYVFVDNGIDEQWMNVLDCQLIVDLFRDPMEIINRSLKNPILTSSQMTPLNNQALNIPVKNNSFTEDESILKAYKIDSIENKQSIFNSKDSENSIIHNLYDEQEDTKYKITPEEVEIFEKQPEVHKQSQQAKILEEIKNEERRLFPRFNISLRVIIKSGKSTFLTFTKDVSIGGLNLMNEVPESIFNSEAEIYITAPDQKNNIMFTCLPVSSRLGKSRLMFTNINQNKQKIFSEWLQQVVKPHTKKVS